MARTVRRKRHSIGSMAFEPNRICTQRLKANMSLSFAKRLRQTLW
jgi:hypothetical protein